MLHPVVYLLNPPAALPGGIESPADPAAVGRLTALGLCRDAIARARSFSSAKRVHEFLWGRALLSSALSRLPKPLTCRERPPLSPVLASCDGTCAGSASITHTAGWIAVMISDHLAAIDAEVMKPGRVTAALVDHVFGQGMFEMLTARGRNPIGAFYALWGLRETAVKVQGKFCVTMRKADESLCLAVQNEQGSAVEAGCGFARLPGPAGDGTLLTVLDCGKQYPAPRISLMRAELTANGDAIAGFREFGRLDIRSLSALRSEALAF